MSSFGDTAVGSNADQRLNSTRNSQESEPARPDGGTGDLGARLELPPELRIGTGSRSPLPAEPPQRERRSRLRPAVLLRVLAALGVIGLACWYLTGRLLLTSSLDGVVSAPLVPLRAPIEGRVRIGEGVEPGGAITAGQTLFTLADDHVDERALADMYTRLETLTDAEQTVVDRMAVLERLQSNLRGRADLHRQATVRRLAAMLAETEAAHESARLQASLTRTELGRARELAGRGVQSAARLDEAETTGRRAGLEAQRLAASTERMRAELDSARQGVVIGDGFADAPYSRQRQDEIAMRLADLAAERDSYHRTRRELTGQLIAEERRLRLLRGEAVLAPAAGLVWSLGVADGARASRGDVLGEFADCGRSYVEATLPARGFDTVRSGDKVRVRLSSRLSRTVEEVPGTVRSLRGVGVAGTATPAASVERNGSGLIKVVVDVDLAALAALSSGGCQIGRSATVLF